MYFLNEKEIRNAYEKRLKVIPSAVALLGWHL